MTNENALAETIRKACIEVARDAYESAGRQGLCAEGRWEAALGALQMLDLDALLKKSRPAESRVSP